jgi:hypothetical protein
MTSTGWGSHRVTRGQAGIFNDPYILRAFLSIRLVIFILLSAFLCGLYDFFHHGILMLAGLPGVFLLLSSWAALVRWPYGLIFAFVYASFLPPLPLGDITGW